MAQEPTGVTVGVGNMVFPVTHPRIAKMVLYLAQHMIELSQVKKGSVTFNLASDSVTVDKREVEQVI